MGRLFWKFFIFIWLGRQLPEKLAIKLLSARPIVMIMSNAMAKSKDKDIRAYVHDQHLQHFSSFANRQVVAEAFSASVKATVCDVARLITTPTLLIAGDIDDITPLDKQRQLNDMFTNSKLEVIKNVGHLTHYETPAAVAGAIKRFIA